MKLMILAGEVSGDRHAAALIRELKNEISNLQLLGMGGPCMEKEGVYLYYGLKDLAVLGLVEVLKKYFHFRKIFNHLAAVLKEEKPAALILVDYPGFNVRFAKIAKDLEIPVLYYISPQIWAWAQWRRFVIASRVEKMFVVFPFEKDFYRGTGLKVEYVGHPLAEDLNLTLEETRGAALKKEIVGLLPGSRAHEVERLFPLMLEVAEEIYREKPVVSFIASAANEQLKEKMQTWADQKKLPLEIYSESLAEIAQKAKLVLVASGTATLECALLLAPMIIVYKVSFLTWLIGKGVIRLPYIGLVNIIRGEKIVPEFIQFQAKAAQIAIEALSLLNSEDKSEKMKSELQKVRQAIGEKGASKRAAKGMASYLKQIKAEGV